MKIIIVGLGRMGTALATRLSKKGADIVAIDSSPKAFEKLDKNFSGVKIVGVGFDKDIMEQAGIERADALVACTNSDEVNIVVARIAKNVYKVPRVIARSYDMGKAEIYDRLGLRTISTTSWGVDRAMDLLAYDKFDAVYEIGQGETNLYRIETPPMLVGREVREIIAPGEIYLTAISRGSETFLPTMRTVIEESDILYVVAVKSAKRKLKSMLGME